MTAIDAACFAYQRAPGRLRDRRSTQLRTCNDVCHVIQSARADHVHPHQDRISAAKSQGPTMKQSR
jgi:hypothetical protein